MRTRLFERSALRFLLALCLVGSAARAQDEAQTQPPSDRPPSTDLEPAANATAGEFAPAKGFDVLKTKYGSLNISFYGLVRYVNQMPGHQTYLDHLGRETPVKARADLYWHRTMIWFSGFALVPELMYVVTVWSLPTTQQTLAFGNLQYKLHRAFTFGAGLGPNLTSRSMQGSHPYWASSDRQMADEFFRGGFSSGAWIKGEPVERLFYTVSANTNISQLGVTATNDARDFAYSASIWWMPTTGEFGERGGVADFEQHDKVATRIGISAANAREDRAAQIDLPPNATQLRLSDGQLAFQEGALADGVTLRKLTYREAAMDLGLKYKGLTLHAEYFVRQLSDFLASGGPVPRESILDHGYMVTAYYMVWPKHLGAYVSHSMVFDDFRRRPWEVAGGLSAFPFKARSVRVNLHVIYVNKSPTGSNFGFYTAGQTGTTVSIGTDILL